MYALNINVLNQQDRNGYTMWNMALEYLIETDNSAVMTLTPHNAYIKEKHTHIKLTVITAVLWRCLNMKLLNEIITLDDLIRAPMLTT